MTSQTETQTITINIARYVKKYRRQSEIWFAIRI